MLKPKQKDLQSLIFGILAGGTGVAICGTPWETLLPAVESDTTAAKTLDNLIDWYSISGRQVANAEPDERGRLGFDDASQDVIVIRRLTDKPEDVGRLLSEITRSLKTDGHLIGELPSLPSSETDLPFAVTPYGFTGLLHGSGLRLLKIHPGPNAMSNYIRNLPGIVSADESEGDDVIDRAMIEYGLEQGGFKSANVMRLMFSTTFVFDCAKLDLLN
ncbi:hypothetical protein ASD52_06670 [Ensifer sp. Root142]|uniref:methyltransferase domain-containing protein n=1 Tax=Ensifer sp. Root142 TaxID=1736461 RepID=UPI00070FA760|nr:methyltransferase domain-containing protein [Ensifer sp. Root142]KQY71359.1 hypothetical protein ASD52_06670 [Ensifer sp. Root142]